jgi:hypothetical protein
MEVKQISVRDPYPFYVHFRSSEPRPASKWTGSAHTVNGKINMKENKKEKTLQESGKRKGEMLRGKEGKIKA